MSLNLGSLVNGFANGITIGDKINSIREDRKNKDIEKQIREAGIPHLKNGSDDNNSSSGLNELSSSENKILPASNDNVSADNSQTIQQTQNSGLSSLQNPAQPTQQTIQQSTQTPAQQEKKPNHGMNLSSAYNAMRDKAFELGRPDLALKYQDIGFQVRDRMYKENIVNAQRQFDLTGDIGGFVKAYNSVVDDGVSVEGYERTDNGYKLKIRHGNNVFERELKPEQIRDMVMNFNDPAARYALERKALDERNKKVFETDEEIRKSKETENNKVHTVGLDSMLIKGDGSKIYDGSGNRPAFKNEQDVYAAANDPKDPRYEVARKIIAQQRSEKVSLARESRAPREIPLEKQAYQDWKTKPENKGLGLSDYMRAKASWGSSPMYDSVTESETKFDSQGNEKKTSRTSKVPKNQGTKEQFNLDDYLK
jgi:hypothetical protein